MAARASAGIGSGAMWPSNGDQWAAVRRATPTTKTSLRTNELSETAGHSLRTHLGTFGPLPESTSNGADPRRPTQRPACLVFTPRRRPSDPPRGLVVHLASRREGRGAARRLRPPGPPALLRHGPDLRRSERQERAARHGPHDSNGHTEHLRRVLAGRGRPDALAGRFRARLYRRCTAAHFVTCSRRPGWVFQR